MDRPLCVCHGEPMLRNGVRRFEHGKPRKTPLQDWRCAIERHERSRRRHHSLEHVAWSKRLLQMRRAHALWLRRQRTV